MKRIRIGIFGVGRGMDIARNLMLQGCDIVAICDSHKERREAAAAALDKIDTDFVFRNPYATLPDFRYV